MCNLAAWKQLRIKNLNFEKHGNSWGQRICNPTAGQQLGKENLQALNRTTVGDRETVTL
jgi:hypothetical protein